MIGITTINSEDNNITNLTTTTKSSLVAAINSNKSEIGDLTTL